VSEYVFSVLYNPALMATKTSILLFYLRLGSAEQIFRWACYFTMAVVNLTGFALTFLNIFQCNPVSAAFKTPIPESAKCENIVTLYLSSAPVNIITDLAMVFLPMPILTSMRLPRKQKVILIITFGAGLFVAVIDVIRIAYLQDAATARLQAQQDGNRDASGTEQRNLTDVSWYAAFSYMWSTVEVNMGIMCGCVPMLKPLVSRYFPSWLRDINVRNLSSTKTRTGSDNDKANKDKVDSMDAAQQTPRLNAPPSPPARDKETLEPAEASCSSTSHNGAGGQEPEEGEMSFMDFLTTADTTDLPLPSQTPTNTTAANNTHTFFDFVNMQKRKSLVEMTVRESLFPNIMVTVLFLIWGIAYGFLDTLNVQFQQAANMSAGQSTGIHSAYFGGYFVAPLTFGRLCLKHWGFKACYIVGLVIYACGVLVFWPSAVLTSFPAFLVSNFIVGMGLSTLEIAANPFVALCGPQRYMEIRLNLSQGVQAIGTVVSPLLAKKVLFRSATDAGSLVDVQWTYLGIALFSILLAVAYFYVPLPEATDSELEAAQAHRADYANLSSIHGVRILWIGLGLAVLSQFAYVGAQEAISTGFKNYHAQFFASSISFSSWQAIGHTAFAVGRFVTAGLNFFIKARYLLLFFYLGAISLASVVFTYSGTTAQATFMLLYFFEGPIFALIFAMALRGVGRHTKDASAVLTAAISGGACWPPIMYGVVHGTGRGAQYGYCVVIAALAVGTLLPVWQNAHPVARKLADPYPDSPRRDRADSMVGRPNSRRSLFKYRRRKEGSSGVEHVEDSGQSGHPHAHAHAHAQQAHVQERQSNDVEAGYTAELNTHGLDI
jgi:fucose permease